MRLAATLSLIAGLVCGNLHVYNSVRENQQMDIHGVAPIEVVHDKQVYLNLAFLNLALWVVLSVSHKVLDYLDW